jgi:L-rhamnose mutarotase
MAKAMIEYLKSQGIKYFMNKNPEINRIAEILEIKLKQGKADLTVKLKGETESVTLSFDYSFEENVICIANVKTSREWLNALADVFKERYSKINLKDKAALLKLLL